MRIMSKAKTLSGVSFESNLNVVIVNASPKKERRERVPGGHANKKSGKMEHPTYAGNDGSSARLATESWKQFKSNYVGKTVIFKQ
jgi:hypothetical protein